LRRERPQQVRLAIEQRRQCRRAQRMGDEIAKPRPRIGDAARRGERSKLQSSI
jgi:hypothetical protein